MLDSFFPSGTEDGYSPMTGSGPKTVSFHTLGCKLNYAETSTFRQSFVSGGFDVVDFRERSDVVLVNTCSVTANADREARKLVRQALRRSPDAYVIVVGCYAQLRPEEIASIEGVDLVLGAEEKFRVMDFLPGGLEKNQTRIFVGDIDEADSFGVAYSAEEGGRTRAFLKVQDGCDYNCSYCTIPMARGASRSQSIEETLKHATEIIGRGFQEIVLSGVNVGDYGSGDGGSSGDGSSFYDLLLALTGLEGDFRIRISSIEPNLLTDEIIALTTASRRLCRHFHIPLQSGSDEVLKLMRRRYDSQLFRERIETIVRHVPDAAIGIDVIVGSPGESRELFEETYRFLVETPFAYLHVFNYSERPGTHAVTIGDKVPAAERAERSRMLRGLSVKKRQAFHESQLGRDFDVLLESGEENGMLSGFSGNYVRIAVPWNPRLEHTLQRVSAVEVADGRVLGSLSGESISIPGYHSLPVIPSATK